MAGETYVVKVQGIDQVRHVGPAPWSHLVGLDVLVASSLEPLFYEQDLGVMVGALGEDSTAASPWGDYVEGNTETRARVDVAEEAEGIFHPLASGALGRVERSDVITEATRFYVQTC